MKRKYFRVRYLVIFALSLFVLRTQAMAGENQDAAEKAVSVTQRAESAANIARRYSRLDKIVQVGGEESVESIVTAESNPYVLRTLEERRKEMTKAFPSPSPRQKKWFRDIDEGIARLKRWEKLAKQLKTASGAERSRILTRAKETPRSRALLKNLPVLGVAIMAMGLGEHVLDVGRSGPVSPTQSPVGTFSYHGEAVNQASVKPRNSQPTQDGNAGARSVARALGGS